MYIYMYYIYIYIYINMFAIYNVDRKIDRWIGR